MMGVWYFSSLLCPRVFYYDYKAKRQQRKWDKENLWIPKHSKAIMIKQRPSHWLTAPYSSSPTLGTLPHRMVRSQASCQAIDKNSDLKSSCSRAHYLHLAFLLPLFSVSLFFSLPLLCLLTPLYSNSLILPLWCNSVVSQLSWSCYN